MESRPAAAWLLISLLKSRNRVLIYFYGSALTYFNHQELAVTKFFITVVASDLVGAL